MGINYIGLACGVVAVALFASTHRLAAGWDKATRWKCLGAAAVLAAPALYQALHYARWLPETAWFYEARSWRGSELVVPAAGVFGGLVAALLPRPVLILPLLATAVAALGPFLKPVLAPVPTREFRDVWTREACIQSTLSTCGPASLATVLRSFGVSRGEQKIARAAHSYRGGTEAWYLARYARAQGVEAVFSFESGGGFPERVAWPAVVGVRVDGRGHFIAILRREGEWFVVADPMVGPERLRRTDLERRYGFTGFALALHRSAASEPG